MVVSKTLALNRYLDFLYAFNEFLARKGNDPVPDDFIMEYTFQWNHHPESDPAQLYKLCPEIMASALRHFGLSFVDAFREFLAAGPPLPHTMFFTHLGSPEGILIRKSASHANEDSPSERYWSERLQESREPFSR